MAPKQGKNIYHPMPGFYLGHINRSIGTMRWACRIHVAVKSGGTKVGTQLKCKDNFSAAEKALW